MFNNRKHGKSYQIALYKGFKSFCFCLLIGSIFSILFVFAGFGTHAVFSEETSDSDLREAIEAGDDSFVISGNIILTNSIEINHNIVLTGSGAIHVAGEFRHFLVNEGATLTIDGDITLYGANGTATEDNIGGGILIDGGIFELVNGEIRYIGTSNQNEEIRDIGTGDHNGAVTITGNGVFYMHGGMIHGGDVRGVLVWGDGIFHMHGGQISENIAKNCNGGGVVVLGIFNLYDGIISNNRTFGFGIFGGGGVHVSQDATFNMHGGKISENTASLGGGVETFGGIFNMHGGAISNNLAGDNGGGVSVFRGVFNMYEGTISYNESGLHGGGIYLYSGHMNLHGGNIIYNKSTSFGGGISLATNSSLYMYDGLIQGNSAFSGGGIFIGMNSLAIIHGGQIKDNFAENHGGGILLVPNSTLTIEGGEIRNNTSLSGGGGIYARLAMDSLTVSSDVIFSGNSTESHYNIGRSRGRERYPQIMWYGDNSLPRTHLLNNYDINFVGRWRPANWQIALAVGGLLGAILFVIILMKRSKKTNFNQGAY